MGAGGQGPGAGVLWLASLAWGSGWEPSWRLMAGPKLREKPEIRGSNGIGSDGESTTYVKFPESHGGHGENTEKTKQILFLSPCLLRVLRDSVVKRI